jgi:hypothetical protein
MVDYFEEFFSLVFNMLDELNTIQDVDVTNQTITLLLWFFSQAE